MLYCKVRFSLFQYSALLSDAPYRPHTHPALLVSATPLFFYIWPCLTKSSVIGPPGIGAE